MRLLRDSMLIGAGVLIAVPIYFVLFAILAASGLIRDRAEFALMDRPLALAIERRSTHPVMPEFDRTLIISLQDAEIIRHPMFPDTAGNVRVNVYRIADDTVWLLDAFHIYKVDFSQRRVAQEPGCPDFVPDGKFIGAFDETHGIWRRRFLFFPAAERGPLPIDYFVPGDFVLEDMCDGRTHS